MTSQNIAPTRVVRTIMRAHGKSSSMIYTNLYDTCRTVKCYGRKENWTAMVDNITSTLTMLGIPHTVKYTNPQQSYSGGPGIIVRLPL